MTLPTWAVVEQMGHVTYGAYVSEVELAGAKLLRLDVPEVERVEYYPVRERRRYHAWHTLIGASSVYRLTPCSEERARKTAATGTHNPDAGWEVIPEVPQIAEAEVVCCGDCLTEIHPLNGCECGQHDGPQSGGGLADMPEPALTPRESHETSIPGPLTPEAIDEYLTALAVVPASPPESAAYWQGFNADGGPNPFPADTTDHADWARGRRDNIPF